MSLKPVFTVVASISITTKIMTACGVVTVAVRNGRIDRMNGVRIVKSFDAGSVRKSDVLGALIELAGGSVSNMPHLEECQTYSNKWEYFDPKRVKDVDDLPEYWQMVYALHNKPDMKDCRDMKYRYVHVPVKILAQYPRVPTQGIFCLCDNDVKATNITADDLIWIGNEFVD